MSVEKEEKAAKAASPAPEEPKPAKKPARTKASGETKTVKAVKPSTPEAKPAGAKAAEAKAAKPAASRKPKADKPADAKPAAGDKPRAKRARVPKPAPAEEAPSEAAPVEAVSAEEAPVREATPAPEVPVQEPAAVEEVPVEEASAPGPEPVPETPRRSVAFIGSECWPFVKTGGLGDVMYALPRALVRQNCDVKVILPRYRCIPWQYQEKMVYRGAFGMDLTADGRSFYVGIMEYVWDGVVYDFIDNEEFFSAGNPYTNLVDDIPKYCYFSKAALAALNFLDWTPDVIHCHDWQAALVPVYLRTLFAGTKLARSKAVLTIHNLKFQGVYNIPTIRYWSGLPDYVFNKDALTVKWVDANMLKGGLTYSNAITTVSPTYAWEIQTPEYGEGLDAHLRYHSGKLRGIVNGIDYGMWDPRTDENLRGSHMP